jgi:pyruvate kinase
MSRRAKIVATVGPATASRDALAALLAAGADVLRLNLSHGDHAWHRERLATARALAAEAGRHLPVVFDLTGPRFRLGELAAPRTLAAGEQVVLGPPGAGADLPVDDPALLARLDPGERVLIDQGLVELAVEARRGERVAARVLSGGEVSSRKGINLPDSEIGFAITDKDRRDIEFAVAEGADYLAASYVATPEDLAAVRAAVRAAGGEVPLIAKLERARAVEAANLERLVAAADAVMVARGDLGVEVPLHRVPVLQKRIAAAGRALGRPVIVATQMLESMMEQPRPTRAEATDVANAVLDGADALMLSGETAAGRWPAAAVETMARIVAEAEDYRRTLRTEPAELDRPGRAPALGRPGDEEAAAIPDLVGAAAVFAARELGARCLVAFSQTGSTGRLLARYRPATPIVVFSNDAALARRLQLVWGVQPQLLGVALAHHDEVVRVVDGELLARGLAAAGDLIVVLMGDPIHERRPPNLVRVHRVRTAEAWASARRAP